MHAGVHTGKKMQGRFATVIIGFFCVAFALWGVERLFNGGGRAKLLSSSIGDEIFELKSPIASNDAQVLHETKLGGKIDPSFLNDKMLRGPCA